MSATEKAKNAPSATTLLVRATTKVIRLRAGLDLRKAAETKRVEKYEAFIRKMDAELSKAEREVEKLNGTSPNPMPNA
jgi:hypothetical protein